MLHAAVKNSWLWSTKLFSRWSVSVEQSAAGNKTTSLTLEQFSGTPAEKKMFLRRYML